LQLWSYRGHDCPVRLFHHRALELTSSTASITSHPDERRGAGERERGRLEKQSRLERQSRVAMTRDAMMSPHDATGRDEVAYGELDLNPIEGTSMWNLLSALVVLMLQYVIFSGRIGMLQFRCVRDVF
jgi:hypothetical protein